MARLKELYYDEIVDAMIKKFGYKNRMEVPKLDKIVVNMGVGEAKDNAKVLENAVADMEIITGQKAVLTKAKNSIANFKIREGMNIGCKTTLRGEKMYECVTSEVSIPIPSMAEETMRSASRSSSFSLRSNTTRSTRPEVWILFLSPPQRLMKKPESC